MGDASAGLLTAALLAGGALGGLLGRRAGDLAERRFPAHGRIAMAQVAVAAGLPLSWLLLKVGPDEGMAGAGCRLSNAWLLGNAWLQGPTGWAAWAKASMSLIPVSNAFETTRRVPCC
jgi:hypothetical protein